MKKTILFAVCLLLTGILMAQESVQVDGIYYLLNVADKTATVTYTPGENGGIGTGTYNGYLNIPEKINVITDNEYVEYTVTAIGDNAFSWCSGLTQITIPATVKTIGLNLLQRTDGVTSLVIADGTEPVYFTYEQGDMGENLSFMELAYTCTSLYIGRNVEVKSSLEYTSPVFHTWNEVRKVTFGENVTVIPDGFCPWCRNIESVQINTARPLAAGQGMFMFLEQDQNPKPDPKNITLYVPEGLKDAYAAMDFWKNFTIVEMDIEKRYGIKYVNDIFDFYVNGFYYKLGSAGVTVVIPQVWYINPDGTYVSQWSSEFPYKQSVIRLPESITVYRNYDKYSLVPQDGYDECVYAVCGIGDYCFRDAKNLTQIIIPQSVKTIGTEAFEYTDKLRKLDIPESVTKVGWLAFGRAGIEEVNIPASASRWIDDNAAFQECDKLHKVNFAAGLTRIQDRMFWGCKALQSISIPDAVVEIGSGAFSACSGLSQIHLPASLEKMNGRMFHGCPLRELHIPAGVKYVDGTAFLGTLLTKLSVDPANTMYDSRDNCNAVIRTADNTLVAACNGTFIPESVDSIASEAFSELEGIRSLTLPKGLQRIAEGAFMNLENLTLITSYIAQPAGVLAADAVNSWNTPVQSIATLYVPAGTKALYQADAEWGKFKNIVEMEGENKPADIEDLKPVENNGSADMSGINASTDLTNAVVNNVYITCDTTNGDGYDNAEKAVVFNTVVDETMMDNVRANEGNMDIIRNNFTGLILQVPAGNGTITIEAKVTGNRAVAVWISGSAGIDINFPTIKTEIEIDYDVLKEAFVYIYSIIRPEVPAGMPLRMPSKILRAVQEVETPDTNNITIYGAKWDVKNVLDGIEEVENPNAAKGEAVKMIGADGQIYILRAGKKYNAAGIEVE